MADANTTVIDIEVRYRDKTGDGPKGTAKDIDRVKKSMDDVEKSGEKARNSVRKLGSSLVDIGRKTITIPVKILDYATRPLRGLFNFATSIKGVLTGIFMGVMGQKMVSQPLALADAYSNALIGFSTLFKSEEKGQKMMNDLDEFARTTPFKTSNVINQSQKMLAMGWNPNDILKDMETIGDAASATGKGDEGLERIVLALAQIKSKGKLSTEELNQLAEGGINAKSYVAEGLGFGTGDDALAKLNEAMQNKKNPIMSGVAVEAILAGMERDFSGMMQTMSKETVSGLKSNIADTFEINIFRKWGQGLQDGAKQGLGAFADMLDENQDALSKLGDRAKTVASQLSNKFADAAEFATKKILNITSSVEFDQANLGGKFAMLWNAVIGSPFTEWWDSKGHQQVSDLSGKMGAGLGKALNGGIMALLGINPSGAAEEGLSIGSSFLNGFLEGFDASKIWDAVKSAMGNVTESASKVLPGGEKADTNSYLSAGLLAIGAMKAGKVAAPFVGGTIGGIKGIGGVLMKSSVAGKVAGALAAPAITSAGTLGYAGATGAGAAGVAATGATGLGMAGVGGLIVGGAGLVIAANDIRKAASSLNEKEKNVSAWTGASRAGMVGAGAGVGAMIGSVVPVIGTAIGAAVGAGVGGVSALLAGGKVGKNISDYFDGTAEIRDTTNKLQDAVNEFEQVTEKTNQAKTAMDQYYSAKSKIDTVMKDPDKYTVEVGKLAEEQSAAIQALMDLYPNLISHYDIENGKLETKLGLIKTINEADRKKAREDAEYAVRESEKTLPKTEEKLRESKEKFEKHDTNYSKAATFNSEVKSLQSEIQTYVTSDVDRNNEYYAKINNFRKQVDTINESENNVQGKTFTLESFIRGKPENQTEKYANKELDARKKQRTVIDEQEELYYSAYDANVRLAKLPEDVDVSAMTSNIEQISASQKTISDTNKAIGEARAKFMEDGGKSETEFKATDEYKMMSEEIYKATDKQKGLQAEVEKYRPQLESVVGELKKINEQYDMIPDEKRISLSVVTEYFGAADSKSISKTTAYGPNRPEESSKADPGLPEVPGYSVFPSGYKGAANGTNSAPNGKMIVGEREPELAKLPGYAVGTTAAPSGYALVGEKGPEVVKFSGGERVFTNAQSTSIVSNWKQIGNNKFAVGSNAAPSGYALVGEKGPEVVKFNGDGKTNSQTSYNSVGEWSNRSTQSNNENRSYQQDSWTIADSLESARDKGSQGEQGTARGITINLGGVHVEVKADGGKGAAETLRGELGNIANELCNTVSVQLVRSFSNMSLSVEGI